MTRKRNNVNAEFFETPSENRDYVLGLLMSDGCVSDKGTVSLGMCDKDIIHKVAKVIEYKNKIQIYKPKNKKHQTKYKLSFTNKEVAAILSKFNIVPRKSSIAKFPNNLNYPYSFLRGLFDGDGNFQCYLEKTSKRADGTHRRSMRSRARVVGTEHIIDNVSTYLPVHASKYKGAQYKNSEEHLWALEMNGQNAAVAVALLYNVEEGSTQISKELLCMDRKKKTAEEILKRYYGT